jgi:hypothetical protein
MDGNLQMRLLKYVHATGAVLSFSCGIHCLAMPIVIALIPALTISYRVNTLILVVSTLLSLASLCWGFKKHTRLSPLIILSVGFTFLFCLNHRSEYHIAFSFIGSMCYVASYLININLCRTCYKCKE